MDQSFQPVDEIARGDHPAEPSAFIDRFAFNYVASAE
jgi:hypothetical protein